MQRPGANPNDMQPTDFLCDFCRRAWDGESAMVEGHKGSLICGGCLSVAYRGLVLDQGELAGPGLVCTMCLEEREEGTWRSPAHEEAVICTRCCKQAAGRLVKEPDVAWEKPV